MKLETFFQKFDLIADAHNAVPRLRELVLNLALQGKFLAGREPKRSSPGWRRVRLDSIASVTMGLLPSRRDARKDGRHHSV